MRERILFLEFAQPETVPDVIAGLVSYVKGFDLPDLIEGKRYRSNESLTFKLPSGKRVVIGPDDLDFFQRLQDLPSETKINMMNLSIQDLQNYINNSVERYKEQALDLLSKRWRDRGWGLLMDFKDPGINEIAFGVKLSKDDLIKKIKKDKLNLDQLKNIVDYFESGRDVYCNEIKIE